MQEQLEVLVALQKVDTDILKFKKEANRIPNEIEKFHQELEVFKKIVGKKHQTIFDLEKQRRLLEREIMAKEEELNKYQRQLFQVKNNKEYSTMQIEISNVKIEISKLENNVLEILEKEEELKKTYEESCQTVKNKQELVDFKEKEFYKELETIKKEIAIKEEERKPIANKVKNEILYEYERVLSAEHRGGIAIVSVKDNSCQGCFISLPPQMVSEIKSDEKLIVCEKCGRFLYWEK